MTIQFVWVVLVQHADLSVWIDSAYEQPEDAEARVLQIEKFDNWLDAYVVNTPVYPAETRTK